MMKIIAEQSTSKASSMSYLPDDMREKNLLFFDIETTGLSPEHAEVFLIGALRLSESGAELHQFWRLFSLLPNPMIFSFISTADDSICRLSERDVKFWGLQIDCPEKRTVICTRGYGRTGASSRCNP